MHLSACYSMFHRVLRRSQLMTAFLSLPSREARGSDKMATSASGTSWNHAMQMWKSELMPVKVRCRIGSCASSHRAPTGHTSPHRLLLPCLCAELQGLPQQLMMVAKRILDVTDGDVGPSGVDGLVKRLTDGVLAHAGKA